MQCPNCNAALVANARFCPSCGTSLPAADASVPLPPGLDPEVSLSQASTVALEHEQAPPQPSRRSGQPSPDAAPPAAGLVHPTQFSPPQLQSQPWSASTQSGPPPQAFSPQPGGTLRSQQSQHPSGSPFPLLSPPKARRRFFPRGVRGCLLIVALVLVILLVVSTSVWAFALRPSLNSMAKDQVGKMLAASMEKINPLATLLVPPALPLPVGEDLIQQALVLPPPSWFSIENLRLTITPENIKVTFQAHVASFSFACTILSVPKVVNGQVIVDTLAIDGPITMVISSDEIKAEVNSYLSKLRDRTHRPITALTLTDHYIWVTLGI